MRFIFAAILLIASTGCYAQGFSGLWSGTASDIDSPTGQGLLLAAAGDDATGFLFTWELTDDGAAPVRYQLANFSPNGVAATDACRIDPVAEFIVDGGANAAGAIAAPTECYPSAVVMERIVCASPEPPGGCPVVAVSMTLTVDGESSHYRFTQRFSLE